MPAERLLFSLLQLHSEYETTYATIVHSWSTWQDIPIWLLVINLFLFLSQVVDVCGRWLQTAAIDRTAVSLRHRHLLK